MTRRKGLSKLLVSGLEIITVMAGNMEADRQGAAAAAESSLEMAFGSSSTVTYFL